jgi:hypothetical protein
MLFWPALARQHPRSRRSAELAAIAPQILSSNARSASTYQHACQSFEPKPPYRQPRISSTNTHVGCQFPIAPAAPSVPHTPRFRALALFGRRPSERVDGLGIPASENLHITRRPRSPCQRSIRETGLVELSILKALGARQGRCSLGKFLPGKCALAVGY